MSADSSQTAFLQVIGILMLYLLAAIFWAVGIKLANYCSPNTAAADVPRDEDDGYESDDDNDENNEREEAAV